MRAVLVGQRGSGYLQRRNLADVDISFSMPRIVVGLHSNPNPSAAAKQLAYTHSNFRRNRLFFFHDVMKVLPGDAEQASDLDLRFACRGEHILSKYSAGMDRAPIRISSSDIFGHNSPPGQSIGEYSQKISYSIDQSRAGFRQERIVEDIRRRGFGAEFDILGQLIDRSRKTSGIDAADAAAFDFLGQDIVADDGAQARQF